MYTYIEHERKDGSKKYTTKGAIKRIKSLLLDDKELLNGRDIKKISDDDLLEIGYNHFGFEQI